MLRSMIFEQNLEKKYVQAFNDYMLRSIYPEAKLAQDYINDEKSE